MSLILVLTILVEHNEISSLLFGSRHHPKYRNRFSIYARTSLQPPPLLSFKLALFCTWCKATQPHSALFEYVSRIFRSFAREDAGSVASGLWRWLVSVSSITAASFKLMHNRAPQSTFFLIVTCCLTVHDGENKKKTKNKRRLTEESRLHRSSSLIYTSGVMGLRCLTGQQWMGKRRGLCAHSCQTLTVHCVKLVIISSLKRCPVTVCPPRLLSVRQQTGPWSRMCLSGR